MPSTLCGIVFDPGSRQATKNTPFLPRDLDWIAGQLDRGSLWAAPMGTELRRTAGALYRELRRRDGAGAGSEEWAAPSLRLIACTAILESARQLTGAGPREFRQVLAAAIAYMEQHCCQPLRVDDLVNQVGCSRARFFAMFKHSTGMTPNDYLQRLRINRAGEMLCSSSQSATDIAYSLGFSSSQYFCNVFRKYTGMTPIEFRDARETD